MLSNKAFECQKDFEEVNKGLREERGHCNGVGVQEAERKKIGGGREGVPEGPDVRKKPKPCFRG